MGVECRPRAARLRGVSAMALFMLAAAVLAGCGQRESPADAPTAPARSAADKTLSIGAQAGTLSTQTLEAVSAKRGLRLRQSPLASRSALESRLLAGGSGFDVVVVPWQFVAGQIRAGLFQPLDKRQLPNLQHADADVMKQLAANDPDNALAVPYRRQTAGIAVERQKFAAVVGDADPYDWSMVFDPLQAAKLASCGVYVPDAGEELIGLALLWLGRDPNSERPDDLAAAAAALRAIKPYVHVMDPARSSQELAAGKACLAVVRDAGAVPRGELEYGIPAQGTVASVDVLAIPADARQVREAHAFIDALIDTEEDARAAAAPLAPAQSFVLSPHGEAYAAEVARLWMEFVAR